MRAVTVSSIFTNLEKLAWEAAPELGPALLGGRFSFAWPAEHAAGLLSEYSLPLGPGSFPDQLARRTGLAISAHGADECEDLYKYVAHGRSAIVAVDSFYLPYRPAYGRVHSGRTVVVHGGADEGEIGVEDPWPPAFTGSIGRDVLERARHSETPLDWIREPIYAGRPIDGEWWSVNLLQRPLRKADWAAVVLSEIYTEATAKTVDGEGEYGLDRWSYFRTWLELELAQPAGRRRISLRRASLILRTELSSRVYLCSFLLAVQRANCAPSPVNVREYYHALSHLEVARNVLTKSLTHYREEYRPYVLKHLAEGTGADWRLANILGQSLSTPSSQVFAMV
jgi:hypothetical protein